VPHGVSLPNSQGQFSRRSEHVLEPHLIRSSQNRSAFDLKSVVQTLVESAARLCDAYDALILLRAGESGFWGLSRIDPD
jgi:hypothetical protein